MVSSAIFSHKEPSIDFTAALTGSAGNRSLKESRDDDDDVEFRSEITFGRSIKFTGPSEPPSSVPTRRGGEVDREGGWDSSFGDA